MAEQSTTRRVLVVSDDQDAGRFLGRVLEDAGLDVVTCSVEDIAIELSSSHPAFDAVLGDSIDPLVSRRVRDLTDPDRAETPIVVLAPYNAGEGAAEAAFANGATAYVTRPVVEHELVKEIHAVLPEEAAVPEESGSEADVEQ